MLLDKMTLRNYNRKVAWLGMSWVDYKKSYDLVLELQEICKW